MYFYYTMWSHPSSSSHLSFSSMSSRVVTTKTSVSSTSPNKLQDPKHSRVQVDCTDSRLQTWDRTRRPWLNKCSTSTEVAGKVLFELAQKLEGGWQMHQGLSNNPEPCERGRDTSHSSCTTTSTHPQWLQDLCWDTCRVHHITCLT